MILAAEQALQSERQNSTKLQEQVQVLDQTIHEHAEQVRQQQQAISLLVSEKASLSAAVERLENTEQCNPTPLSRRHYLIDCATPQLYKRQKGYFKMSCPEVPNSKSALLSWSLRRRRQPGASLRSQNRRGTSRISHGIRYTPTLSCPIHSSNVVPYPGTRNSVVECSGKRAPDAI